MRTGDGLEIVHRALRVEKSGIAHVREQVRRPVNGELVHLRIADEDRRVHEGVGAHVNVVRVRRGKRQGVADRIHAVFGLLSVGFGL